MPPFYGITVENKGDQLTSEKIRNLDVCMIYVNYGVRTPKFILAPCAQLYSLAETPQPAPPPPRIWAHIRGRYIGQPRLTTSLCDPLVCVF
jgi:hypothetical protein